MDEFQHTIKKLQQKLARKRRKLIELQGRVRTLELTNYQLQLQNRKLLQQRSDRIPANKLAAEVIWKNELKYRTILENMSLGLLEVDHNDFIIKAYPAFCEMTGYSQNELEGKNATQLLLPLEYRNFMVRQNHLRELGKSGVYEIEVLKKDGTRIWVMISGTPIFNAKGQVVGSMGIHYDLSRHKTLEEELDRARKLAEAAQAAEKQFLANMSHEIRTPLNAIVGMSYLLEDTPLNTEQQELLQILQSSASMLKALISDILDFSKIDAGKYELQMRTFNLVDLLQATTRTFELKLRDRPIRFTLNMDFPIEGELFGDDLLLNQILFNLLGNAEKFTHHGEIGLQAYLLEEKDQKVWLQFCVRDTGIGMTAEEQKTVFYDYRQAHKEARYRSLGTGLGLTISKRLIELQGGRIWLESNPGEGTSFFFTLPYQKAKQKKNGRPVEKIIQFPDAGVYRLLVVEDNLMNQKYISTLLQRWGFNYDLAENGAAALELIRQNTYDLVFMDLHMPHMSGYETTLKIRTGSPAKQSLPIIALTASAIQHDKNRALNIGMTDFLPKPYSPNQLSAVIQKYLYGMEQVVPEAGCTERAELRMDKAYLRQIYLNDRAYAEEMFELFLQYTAPDIPLVRTQIEQEDWAAVTTFAHRLHPALSMVGFTKLAELSKQLYELARRQEKQEATILFDHFFELYQIAEKRIFQEYRNIQQQQSDLFL